MKKCKEDEDILAILIANRDNLNELKNSMNELSNAIMEFGDFFEEWIKQTESYTDLALKTLNKDVFEQKDLILNASLGLSGEVGEVNDIIKKYMYHGHKLDDDTKEKIILELGDVCWYVALMAWAIDKTKFEDVLNKNIEKLEKRYHGEFTTEKSVNRKEDSDNSCEEKKNDSNDNDKVPLVWNHDHQDPSRVLGHAMLKNVPNEGVYAYCSVNDTNDEAWRKLLSYLENDVAAQEEYCSRQSMESEEKKNDCEFEFETTLSNEEWSKIVRYGETDVDAQEEYYARKSKEGEEKDTKKTSDDTKTNNNLSVKDALVKDFLNLLFGKNEK